jgi:hypothetical protein
MPHWAWVATLLLIVVGLFAFLLRIGGGEPSGREDAGVGDTPGDSHWSGGPDGHGGGGGGHH